MYVVQLSHDAPSSLAWRLPTEMLMSLVGQDYDKAMKVWDSLVTICEDAMARRLRLTRESLNTALTTRGHQLSDTAISEQSSILLQLQDLHTLVDGIAASTLRVESAPVGPPPAKHEDGATGDPRVGAWQGDLDAARRLLDLHQPTAALSLLRGLDGTLASASTPPPTDLRRRVLANIGVALVRLGDFTGAAPEFERALALDPNDKATLVNLGRVELVLGKADSAEQRSRQALANDPTYDRAWGLLIELERATLSDVPPAVAAEPAVLTAEGLRLLQKARTESGGQGLSQATSLDMNIAVSLLRRAAEAEQGDPEHLFLLARSLMQGPRSAFFRTSEPEAVLEEVDGLATRALEAYGDTKAYSVIREQLLLLRSSVRRGLRRDEEALKDAEVAYHLQADGAPERWRSAFLYAGLLLDKGDAERALGVLESALPVGDGPAGPPGLHLMRARTYFALGRSDKVMPEIDRTISLAGPEEPDLVLAAIEIAISAGYIEEAAAHLGQWQNEDGDWMGDLLLARVAAEREDVPTTEACYRSAIAKATAEAAAYLRYEYGSFLSSRENFEAALDQFRQSDLWDADPSTRAPLVRALLETDQLSEVADRLARLEREGPLPIWALRAAVSVAEMRNDLPQRKTLLEQLHKLQPEDVQVSLQLASTYSELGLNNEAIQLFGKLLSGSGLKPQERMHAAHYFFRLGRHTEAVKQAFRAVREDPDDPEMHRGFMTVFMWHERVEGDSRAFSPRSVGIDTVVTLTPEGKGDPIQYTILDDVPVSLRQNELHVSDKRVAALVKKQVGASIVLRRGQPGQRVYRIARIDSVFVQEYRDIMQHFGERFPDNTSVQQFFVGDGAEVGDLAAIMAEVQRHADHRREAVAFYEQHFAPLGSMARILREDIGTAYNLLTHRGGHYFVDLGSQADQSSAIQAAGRDGPVVLSYSFLATARFLANVGVDALAVLQRSGRRICMPQSLLSELREQARLLELQRREGRMTLGIGPAGLQGHEVAPEVVEQEYQATLGAIEWVSQNVEVLPRPLPNNFDLRKDLVGISSADALDLVQSEGADLLADDLGLRVYFGPEVKARSFPTWALLKIASTRELITSRQMRDGLVRLIELSHHFIPLNAATVLQILEDRGFILDATMERILGRMAGPDVNLDSGVTTLSEFLQGLAITGAAATLLEPVTRVCLESLTDGRRMTPTISALEAALDRTFRLLPVHRREVQEVIERFAENKERSTPLQI